MLKTASGRLRPVAAMGEISREQHAMLPRQAGFGQEQTSAFHFRAAKSLYVLLSFHLAHFALAGIGINLFPPGVQDGQILP